jgi:GT2 family glycosyltransferase
MTLINLYVEEELPNIDIIIITHDSEKTIAKCLQAVYLQNYPKLNVIIVDNKSSDRTTEVLIGLLNNLLRRNVSFNFFPLKYNLGFAKAVKFALKFSSAEYVLLLNPDAVMEDSNYIKTLIEVMSRPYASKIGILTGLIKNDGIVISDGAFFDPLTGFDWSPSWKDRLPIYEGKFMELRDYVPLTAALVRRDLLELLDERYFLYNEDLDLALCARQRGYYSAVVLQTHVEHKVELRKRKLSRLRAYYHIKGRLYFLWKNLPYPFLLTSFLFWVITFPLISLFIDKSLARICILAIAHFFKEKGSIVKGQEKCRIVSHIRTVAALRHIVKHLAYGGHSW